MCQKYEMSKMTEVFPKLDRVRYEGAVNYGKIMAHVILAFQ